MLFIGGPMHGKPVPDELRSFINSQQEEIMPVKIIKPDDQGLSLVEAWEVYIKKPYWRLGKPLLYFYSYIGMGEEESLAQAREHLGL